MFLQTLTIRLTITLIIIDLKLFIDDSKLISILSIFVIVYIKGVF